MRRSFTILALALAAPMVLSQRHGGRSAPATAPVAPPVPTAPVKPISSGLGAIQFVAVNFGVPAPQSLTRQLRFDDDRTRAAALSAIGAPGQYLQRGHIPMPRSISLDLLPMGNSDDLDALLTVELDQHLVTAILIPVDGNWRRVATLIYATPFENRATTPTTWLRTARTLVQKERYRAIFHASTGSMGAPGTPGGSGTPGASAIPGASGTSGASGSPGSTEAFDGNFVENEAQVRILNGHAVVTLSFESTVRECAAPPTSSKLVAHSAVRGGCNVTQRWFQPDPAEPISHFELVTATGRVSPKEADDPLASSHTMLLSHLRNFSCQPFLFSETTERFEPSAANGPCRAK